MLQPWEEYVVSGSELSDWIAPTPFNYERYAGHQSLMFWDQMDVRYPRFLLCVSCGAKYRLEDLERLPSHEVGILARVHNHGW